MEKTLYVWAKCRLVVTSAVLVVDCICLPVEACFIWIIFREKISSNSQEIRFFCFPNVWSLRFDLHGFENPSTTLTSTRLLCMVTGERDASSPHSLYIILLNVLALEERNLTRTLTLHSSCGSLSSSPVLSELFFFPFTVTISRRQDHRHHGHYDCSHFNCGISISEWHLPVYPGLSGSAQVISLGMKRQLHLDLFSLICGIWFSDINFSDCFWLETKF